MSWLVMRKPQCGRKAPKKKDRGKDSWYWPQGDTLAWP